MKRNVSIAIHPSLVKTLPTDIILLHIIINDGITLIHIMLKQQQKKPVFHLAIVGYNHHPRVLDWIGYAHIKMAHPLILKSISHLYLTFLLKMRNHKPRLLGTGQSSKLFCTVITRCCRCFSGQNSRM